MLHIIIIAPPPSKLETYSDWKTVKRKTRSGPKAVNPKQLVKAKAKDLNLFQALQES